MEVAEKLEETGGWPHPRVVAVGFFDGVHRGHQELLRRTVQGARAVDGVSVVLTFDPHPLVVINPSMAPAMLSTMEDRIALMVGLGVDKVVKLTFDEDLRQLSAAAFASEVLLERLVPRQVVVGFNFSFGRGGSAGVEVLRGMLMSAGVDLKVVCPVVDEGTVISSTVIREMLQAGEVHRAAALLGRPHQLRGSVRSGAARGRRLGFPTCNLAIPAEIVLPRQGVYAVWALLPGGMRVMAVCNVGVRPTFGGTVTSVEAHLIDHAGDYYGETVTLQFCHRLRDEQQFASPQDLVRQIEGDVRRTREYFSSFASSMRL